MNQMTSMHAGFATGIHGPDRQPFRASRPRPAARACEGMERKSNAGMYGIRACITQIDRAIIRGYFQQDGGATPLSHIGNGLPSLDSRWQPLPRDLECKLSVLTERYVRALAANDVILIDIATARIVDAMPNVHMQGQASSQTQYCRDRERDAIDRSRLE